MHTYSRHLVLGATKVNWYGTCTVIQQQPRFTCQFQPLPENALQLDVAEHDWNLTTNWPVLIWQSGTKIEHTAGVSDSHAWGLMLPSSSRVSPVTYHSVVAVRYPDLCRVKGNLWELRQLRIWRHSRTTTRLSICTVGYWCKNQRSCGSWPRHISLARHCRLRRQHRLFQRPFCHRLQEQSWQVHHQKDLFPNASRGNHR